MGPESVKVQVTFLGNGCSGEVRVKDIAADNTWDQVDLEYRRSPCQMPVTQWTLDNNGNNSQRVIYLAGLCELSKDW